MIPPNNAQQSDSRKREYNTDRPCRLVIKFKDDAQIPYQDGAEKHLEELGLTNWSDIESKFAGLTLRPMFTSVKPDRLVEMTAQAAKRDPTYHPPNFLTYFTVECKSVRDAGVVLNVLTSWPHIENAYIESPPTAPPGVFNDPLQPTQRYQDPAPAGIDAEYAWLLRGGRGLGIGFVDFEEGWIVEHPDLPPNIELIHGMNVDDPSRQTSQHGLGVLGVVVGKADNNFGIAGTAPHATARVASPWLYSGSGGFQIADAILAVADQMVVGDVLLIELQSEASVGDLGEGADDSVFMPVEIENAIFDAIRLVTGLGIVVVEVAGNGSTDLDDVVRFLWWDFLRLQRPDRPFRRGAQGFKDSRAIIVGATNPDGAAPFPRKDTSNFGSRVDCHAVGHMIATTGPEPPNGDVNLFRTEFNGTSGAAAIVAGAAILVNGIVEAHSDPFSPTRLDSESMRNILSDTGTGTASRDPNNDRIGVMPNVRRIVEERLNLGNTVFLRDHLEDAGQPHSFPLGLSPDVLLVEGSRTDPLAGFEDPRPDIIQSGAQDKFLVWRVNRSDNATQRTIAVGLHFYLSTPKTRHQLSEWKELFSTRVSVPVEGAVGNFFWPKAGREASQTDLLHVHPIDPVPHRGVFSLIAAISFDPFVAPPPHHRLDSFDDTSAFDNFVRNNREITYKDYSFIGPPEPGLFPGCRTLMGGLLLLTLIAIGTIIAVAL